MAGTDEKKSQKLLQILGQDAVRRVGEAAWRWLATWEMTEQLIIQVEAINEDKKGIEYMLPMSFIANWKKDLRGCQEIIKKEFTNAMILCGQETPDPRKIEDPTTIVCVNYRNGTPEVNITLTSLAHLKADTDDLKKCKEEKSHTYCGQVTQYGETRCPHAKFFKFNEEKSELRSYCSKECMKADKDPGFFETNELCGYISDGEEDEECESDVAVQLAAVLKEL